MIRAATLDDVPQMLRLGEAMHAESPRFSRLRFDIARSEATLRHLVASPQGFAWVACVQDEIVGGLLAFVTAHWCSTDLIASDLAMFFAPHARGGLAPARLVNRYRAWAQEHGAVITQLGVTTGVQTEATASLYERIGLKRCGVILEA